LIPTPAIYSSMRRMLRVLVCSQMRKRVAQYAQVQPKLP
jgi:hypothetical protein